MSTVSPRPRTPTRRRVAAAPPAHEPSRRVLVTGLGTYWGGRVTQALEADDNIETIIGLDSETPTVSLERTEFVRVDPGYSALAKVVRLCGIDTVLHTFLVVDPTTMSRNRMHEINVIGTMNLFAAVSTPDTTVRKVIVKSSTSVYGCGPEDPVWFTEDTPRRHGARGRVERSLLQVESYVNDFALDNPDVVVSLLRFSNVIGEQITTPFSRCLELPAVPSVFGFDPRVQFVHAADVIRALLFCVERDVRGTYNVAGEGLLPWSEVAALCKKPQLPLPPVGERTMAAVLRTLGIVDLPPETLKLLRLGRGIDNRRFKGLGFEYGYTSAEAVLDFVRAGRLRRTIGTDAAEYSYNAELEQFFKHSPAVLRNRLPRD